jgi:hypothetical protein
MHGLPSWPVRGANVTLPGFSSLTRLFVSHGPRIVTCSAVVPVVWFQALVSGCCPAVDWTDSRSLGGGLTWAAMRCLVGSASARVTG